MACSRPYCCTHYRLQEPAIESGLPPTLEISGDRPQAGVGILTNPRLRTLQVFSQWPIGLPQQKTLPVCAYAPNNSLEYLDVLEKVEQVLKWVPPTDTIMPVIGSLGGMASRVVKYSLVAVIDGQ